MAKINWQDIGELTAVDQNGINKAIVIPAKEALRQTRFALGGNLTIKDNMYAAVVTFSMTHGVEYTFQNPLKTTPIGFEPILTRLGTGSQGLGCFATLNPSRTDGLIGLTCQFQTSGTNLVESLLPASPNPPLLTSLTVVNLNTITCDAGAWDISCVSEVGFGTGVASTDFAAGISLTSATIPPNTELPKTWARSAVVPTAASDVSVAVAPVRFEFSTSTSVYHVARFTFSAGSPRAFGFIHASRVGPISSYTANVTGILWGG